jgi:diguanylate cyclase
MAGLPPCAESTDQRDAQGEGHDLRGRSRSIVRKFPVANTADRIDQVGSQVKGEIDQVMAMIDAAVGSASSYTESLAGATEQLVHSKDRDGLRTIVETLVQTTKAMEISNRHLEERLHASKQEIDDLQENLEAVRTESLTDPLTQLANRKFFDSTFEKPITEAVERNERCR